MTNGDIQAELKKHLERSRKKSTVARGILETFGLLHTEAVPALTTGWESLHTAVEQFEKIVSGEDAKTKDDDKKLLDGIKTSLQKNRDAIRAHHEKMCRNEPPELSRKDVLAYARELDKLTRSLSVLRIRYAASSLDQRLHVVKKTAAILFAVLLVVLLGVGSYFAATHPALDEGLAATYFSNRNFGGLRFVVVDHEINFSWITDRPLKGIGRDNFSIRWEGCVIVDRGTNARLVAGGDDGIRVFVENKKVIDAWDAKEFRHHKANEVLEPGIYPIKVEYYEDRGEARAFLGWSLDDGEVVAIPFENLVPATTGPGFGSRNARCPRTARKY